MTSHHRSVRAPRAVIAAAGAALVLGAGLWASEARAQMPAIPESNGHGFDLHLFRPAMDSKGQFTVNGTDILGAWNLAFGLVVDWGRGLGRIGTREGMPNQPLVENMFTGQLFANVGLANWFVVGLSMPWYLTIGGPVTGLNAAEYNPPPAGLFFQGAGELALNVKFRFLRVEVTHFGGAIILSAGMPLSDAARHFSGDPGFSLWPQLAFEWRPVRAFRIDLNAGFRYFTGEGSTFNGVQYAWPMTAGLGMSLRLGTAVDLVAETYLASYTNAFFRPNATPWEAVGGLKIFVDRNSYLMLGAGSRIPLGDPMASANFRAFIGFILEPSIGDSDGDGLRDDIDRCPTRPEDFDFFQDTDGCPEPDNDQDGILDAQDHCPNTPEDRDGDHDDDGCPEGDERDRDGDGILDRVDQCPDEAEDRDRFQDEDGCPDRDNDNDGILDTDDLCPNEAEDRDGFEDANGCPEPDNDHDRILDTRDRCPNDPETYNGTDDDDGCPDTGQVVVEEGQIRILQSINFETNSARIRPDSMPIVEAVARTLIGNPQIEVVEVQGHADERGDDEHNLRLTQDRAASVVQALVERGVARERLHAAGYGERCRYGYPATPGQDPGNAVCQHGGPRWCHSPRAWNRDRRVVFIILRTSDGPTGVRVVCDEGADLIPPEDRQYHRPGQ